MAEKVTVMTLKVDLQCEKCYKKVKKVLCKFPREIRDQSYDFQNNEVIIQVFCCSPEKIRDKICYKGGGSIKSIQIDPEKKKKEPEKPKAKSDKPKEKPADKPQAALAPNLVPGYPLPVNPIAMYGTCYGGRESGPFFQGYGGPPQCYEGYYARPVYDSYGGARPHSGSRYDNYLSEENQSGCTIM
ncbi:pollen-specific leucine-rich repeat extensin-like protein 1 isoform X1 [Quillaja saponaria]|uniref:Pollen-specific leucine-rich repeat extensin-like protein 1 isoform X1 n=1 Tax=Quillaja saponaria TaxID=32244 RepID=A0AAD7VFT1_QUISA|nr:pollen-specific leucine-rich repeat extensin-like protein 1 isoform X1 [Quillaja saponaria]